MYVLPLVPVLGNKVRKPHLCSTAALWACANNSTQFRMYVYDAPGLISLPEGLQAAPFRINRKHDVTQLSTFDYAQLLFHHNETLVSLNTFTFLQSHSLWRL